MSDFQKIATLTELRAANGKLCCEWHDQYVVVVLLGNDVFCLDDVCTHDGGPLGDGAVEDGCLICPRHGAKFDIRTGEAVCMPATEPTTIHQVRLEGDDILVKLSS